MRTKIDIYDFIFDTLLHGSYLLRGLQSGSLIHIYRSLQYDSYSGEVQDRH